MSIDRGTEAMQSRYLEIMRLKQKKTDEKPRITVFPEDTTEQPLQPVERIRTRRRKRYEF